MDTKAAREQLKTMQEKVSGITDRLRGLLQADEPIRLLLEMSVIAKHQPKEFELLYKQPKVAQSDYLATMLNTLPNIKGLDSLVELRTKKIPAEALNLSILGLYGIGDFAALSKVLQQQLETYNLKVGSYYPTGNDLVELIKQLAGDVTNASVFDGAAGICNLVSALSTGKLTLAELNETSKSIGQNILLLNDVNAEFTLKDSLLDVGKSQRADLVVTQPPFGIKLSSEKQNQLINAPYIQFDQGKRIPASAGDALWIQHALYQLNDTGRAIILLPTGWLFRGGYDAKLRQYLLDNDLIETLIGLPAGLLSDTAIPTVLLVLNKAKPESNTSIIKMVNADKLGKRERKRTALSVQEINLIAELAQGKFPESERFKSILVPDVLCDDQDLSISRFFIQEEVLPTIDLEEENAKLTKVQNRFNTAQTKLLGLLNGN